MKSLLKIALCACLVLNSQLPILNSVQAQITHSDQGQVDKYAVEVLKKAASQFDNNVGFTVTAITLDAQKKETLRQTAQVLYHKGKYRLTVADQVIVCDGTTVWQWNKPAKEVVVNNVGTDDVDLMNPARLLANYDKSFRAKYIRTEEDGTAIVDLQPRSSRNFHKIRLMVNEKTGLLRGMEVHKYDSSREMYNITAFKRVNTPATQFTFDPKKHGVAEIIDMR